MNISKVMIVGALSAVMASPVVVAANSLSSEQQKDVENIVHDYLVHHPEVLVEVSQALQQKQQHNVQEQAKTAIMDNAKELFGGTLGVVGNPKGAVTLVEFFDYQCIHCKKMATTMGELVKKDHNLRVIYKEFPIFGKSSDVAAKVALAAGMQGKYILMHDGLLTTKKRLNDKVIMGIAKSVGLDMAQLQKDMNSKTVTEQLDANRQLAEKMHLMGTPAFVIASTPAGQFDAKKEPTFIPGAADQDVLQEMIKKAGTKG